VGRYANRIADGTFTLDGEEYNLPLNDEPHGVPCSLHGGENGFDSRVWEAEVVEEDDRHGLKLSRRSEDGEEGYPGNLDVTVTYLLTEDNELQIEYEAETDKATPINLTQHSYFNLKGEGAGKVLKHRLQIMADRYTPIKEGLIPTGEIEPVEGTPLDFTEEHTIGERIEHDHEQLRLGSGYDHNYVLNDGAGEMGTAARVTEPESGRVMEVRTDQPGMQFYAGNALNGVLVGKSEGRYVRHAGFCLETQHFPDSPNQPDFPSTILQPDETFRSKTVFAFSIW
jgi:aldose 1-epimerase